MDIQIYVYLFYFLLKGAYVSVLVNDMKLTAIHGKYPPKNKENGLLIYTLTRLLVNAN